MKFTEQQRNEIYKMYNDKINQFFDNFDWRVSLSYEETFDMTLKSIEDYMEEKKND